MLTPKTHYLERDGTQIAYQTFGDGPGELLMLLDMTMHLDLIVVDPYLHSQAERLGRAARTVLLQQRGVGLSEPVAYVPSFDQMADDVLAVMDEAGLRAPVLIGVGSGCAPVALAAARAPARVPGLLLVQPLAQGPDSASAEALVGWDASSAAAVSATGDRALEDWGNGRLLESWDSEMDSAHNRRVTGMAERASMSPQTARAVLGHYWSADTRSNYASVQTPARVLRLHGSKYPEGAVRHVADLMPGGSFHPLPPAEPGMSLGEIWKRVMDHVDAVVLGGPPRDPRRRFFSALLFTDVVDSSGLIARLGNPEYQRRFAAHAREARETIECFGGELQQVKGDGTFSAFTSVADAIRAAAAIQAGAEVTGLTVRAGVHAGDVEREGPELTGLSVHVTARVCAAAGGGEILITASAAELARGAGFTFAARGRQTLKGIEGQWPLLAATEEAAPSGVEADAPAPRLSDRVVLTLARRAPRLTRRIARADQARARRRAVRD